jgi:hypothetical protein
LVLLIGFSFLLKKANTMGLFLCLRKLWTL